jgi:hypothetical protein
LLVSADGFLVFIIYFLRFLIKYVLGMINVRINLCHECNEGLVPYRNFSISFVVNAAIAPIPGVSWLNGLTLLPKLPIPATDFFQFSPP